MSAVALTAVLAFPPLVAHTDVELAVWEADWHHRVEAQGFTPFDPPAQLMAEYAGMKFRHRPARMVPSPVTSALRITGSPTPMSAGVEQWRPLVAHYWPADQVDLMLKVIDCESGGVPSVPNRHGSGALGLFQIMPLWQKGWPGDYTDPWTNAAVAYQIWLTQGLGAWRSSRGCWG